MKGTNTIILNQESILSAVQGYLDLHLVPHVELTNVTPIDEASGGSFNGNWIYELTIEEIPAAAAPGTGGGAA